MSVRVIPVLSMTFLPCICFLTQDIKRNIYMSYETLNFFRKKPKVKYDLRTSWQGGYPKPNNQNIDETIWYLIPASFQIYSRGSAYGILCLCARTYCSSDHQNSSRCCPQTSALCSNKPLDSWRNCSTRGINLPDERGIQWVMAPAITAKFFWNLFLIVYWLQSLSRLTLSWSLLKCVVWAYLLN